jgi:CRISPR-associated endonuclease/helicase Cas3
VSFGVVRMANISPCVDLAKHLLEHQWPEDTQVRVMAYHSQQVLLLRSNQECHLDEVLKRKEKPDQQPQAFTNLIIRRHLDQIKNHDSDVKNVVFIVVATPVEEVGRDHDFDWAVIEPSSYRSIIQLAGRVHRHRKGKVEQPNISLLQYNWKGIRDYHLVNHKVFNHPGFEDNLKLNSHDLNQLVDVPAIANRLDAIPRIEKPTHLTANVLRALEKADSLAELEHAATWSWLSNYKLKGPHTLQGYLNEAWFLTALPQKLTPFRQSTPSLKSYLVFMPETAQYKFCERNELGYPIDRESALNIHRIELSASAMDKLWLTRDFSLAVETMAEQQEISRRSISLRYGELEMPDNERQHYAYNDQLGLVKI